MSKSKKRNLTKIERKKYKEELKKKNESKIKRIQTLNKFANNLNKVLPKSEQWFIDKISSEAIPIKFYRNKVFNNTFIPDLINNLYQLIIEVDGSIHTLPDQIIKDKKKDEFYRKKGYEVIRVVAYNEDSYKNAISLIKQHINSYKYHKIASDKIKTLKRRAIKNRLK